MGQFASSVTPAAVALLTGLLLLFVWLAARRYAARQITGRARDDAERLLRDAEAKQKELLLAAKEESHTLRQATEAEARKIRAQAAADEQALAARKRAQEDRDRALAERTSAATQKDQELGGARRRYASGRRPRPHAPNATSSWARSGSGSCSGCPG